MPRSFALVPVAAAALLAATAQAQSTGDTGSRPWYVGVNQAFAHESGVFASGSDTSSTTTLRGGVDTRVGRGRGWADANLRHQRFNNNEVLNNNGYDLRGGLEWESAGNLSGSFSGAGSRRLTRLSVANSGTVRNLETINDLAARVRLGTAGPLGIEGGIGRRELFYSAPERDADEFRENRANLGVSYRLGGALTVGTGAALAQTTYPRFLETTPGVFTKDESKRREIYFTANWVPTGLSTINARIAATRLRYDINTPNDFNGLTGNISWLWRATGKITVTSALSREAGSDQVVSTLSAPITSSSPTPTVPATESSPSTPATSPATSQPAVSSFQGQTSVSRVTNQLSTRAEWAATGKINAFAGLAYARQTGGIVGSENILTTSIGVRWAPTRTLSVGCDATAENRSVSEDARRFGCYGEFLLN